MRRKIVDYLTGIVARFDGCATLTREGFREEGQFIHGDSRMHATRVYGMRSTPAGVVFSFPAGGDFIELNSEASQTTIHVCGADTYVGRFFFVDRDTWAEAWRVTGPRKRYASLSRYTRVS